MLGKYGETLVVDWGLCKALGYREPEAAADEQTLIPSSGSGSSETLPGSAIGTPAYMSPEQSEGRIDDLGPASDVYSLGATLYTILTGKEPFEATVVGVVLGKVQTGDFAPPVERNPSVPRALNAICLKAMSLRPKDRYPSCAALASDIEHWLADEPVGAFKDPPSTRAVRWIRRHRVAAATTAALIAAAFFGLVAGTAFWAARIPRFRAAMRTAESEKKRAEENFRQTRQAIDKYFTLISESRLIDVPGAEPLREGLLRAALEYYQKFPKTESDDAEIQAELAASYCRMANIQNVTGAGEWLPTFDKGVEIIERLINAKTPIEKFKSLNAGVADVSSRHSQIDPGLLSAARQTFERAVRVWGKLVEASPTSEGFRHDWAYLSDVLTTIKLNQSSDPKVLPDVLAASLRCREIWQKLAAEHPEKPHYRAAVVLEDCALAAIYIRQTDPSAATIALRRAEALAQSLVNDFPAVPHFRDHLARFNYRWNLYYVAKNVPAEADAMRKWMAVLGKLVADFPTVPAYRTTLEGAQKQCRTMASLYVYSDQPVHTKDLLAFLDLHADIAASHPTQQPAVNRLRAGGTQGFDNAPVGFPAATPYLEWGGLELIKKGLDKLEEPDRRQLMAQLSVRAEAGGRAANTYKMAEVVALWWNNDRVAAINRLEEYARQMPDDLSFQLALTRARAAGGTPNGATALKRDNALDGLFSALRNSGNNPENAHQIIASIRRLDPNGKRSQERWSELLADDDVVLRRLAFRGLPTRLLKQAAIASALKQGLTDNDIALRIAAAERLWELNQKRDQVVPTLTACLADESAVNRSAAAAALADMGQAAAETRPALFAALIVPDTPAEDLAEILKAIERVDPVGRRARRIGRRSIAKPAPRCKRPCQRRSSLPCPTAPSTSELSNPLRDNGSNSPIRRCAWKARSCC